MRALIRGVGDNLVRRRFNSSEELVAAVYASLVRILEERELIRLGPFDATFCRNASLDDLTRTGSPAFSGWPAVGAISRCRRTRRPMRC